MKESVKLGYVGLGRRGFGMLNTCFSEMSDVQVAALCDLNPAKVQKGAALLQKKGRPIPDIYADYHDMLKDPSIDCVVIMTGWNDRLQCAMDCMEAGKYTAIEVGCAYDLFECHQLIAVYERTKTPVMMLENCCYGRQKMAALRMNEEGLFGQIAPLTEASIANGGAPVAVPDFTKGKWFRRKPAVPGKYALDALYEDPGTPIIP